MTQINLLPWREQIRQENMLLFGFNVLTYLFYTFVVIVIINIFIYSLTQYHLNRNDYLRKQLGSENSRLVTLNKEMQELENMTKELDFIHSLKMNSYQAVNQLNEIANIVPDAILLSQISRDNGNITLIGYAKSNLQITAMMRNIVASTIFKQPNLTEINVDEKSKDQKKFILKMETTDTVKK